MYSKLTINYVYRVLSSVKMFFVDKVWSVSWKLKWPRDMHKLLELTFGTNEIFLPGNVSNVVYVIRHDGIMIHEKNRKNYFSIDTSLVIC